MNDDDDDDGVINAYRRCNKNTISHACWQIPKKTSEITYLITGQMLILALKQ